jgi:8-oxo-dGTP pyrophosphatase MutT (NUDIX family)
MKPRKTVEQAAAIALWKGRVCLVTSRSGKRWVVPKGRLEDGKSYDEIALQEAWEEAGLRGEVRDGPVGTYFYFKAGKVHSVKVFVMEVTRVLDHWPERHRRERRWVRPEKALSHIREDGLRSLLLAVSRPLLAA